MGQPHKHAELIKAWADGAEIELMKIDGTWVDADVPTWSEWCAYRIKPEPPKYPQTRMSDAELQYHMPVCTHEFTSYVRRVADVAIARAIEDGQVIPLGEHLKEVGKAHVDALFQRGYKDMVPAAMLEKVGQAVADLCRWNVPDKHMADIIAKVKEGK